MKDAGLVPSAAVPDAQPLDWLIHGDVETLIEAAYRFAAAPPEVACVLTGTADPAHLEANVEAVGSRTVACRRRQAAARRAFGAHDEYFGD